MSTAAEVNTRKPCDVSSLSLTKAKTLPTPKDTKPIVSGYPLTEKSSISQFFKISKKPHRFEKRQFDKTTLDGISLSSFFFKEEDSGGTESNLSNENENSQQSQGLYEMRYSNLVLDRKPKNESKKSVSENSATTILSRDVRRKKFSREVSTKIIVNVKPFKEYLPSRPNSAMSERVNTTLDTIKEAKHDSSGNGKRLVSTASSKTAFGKITEETDLQKQASNYYSSKNLDSIFYPYCGKQEENLQEDLCKIHKNSSVFKKIISNKELKENQSTETKENLEVESIKCPEEIESSLQTKRQSTEKNECVVGTLLEKRFSNLFQETKIFENRMCIVELQTMSTIEYAASRIEETLLQILFTSTTMNETYEMFSAKFIEKDPKEEELFFGLKELFDESRSKEEPKEKTRTDDGKFLRNFFLQKHSGFIKCHPMLQDRLVKVFKRKAKSYENVIRNNSAKPKKISVSFAVVEDEVCRYLVEKERHKAKEQKGLSLLEKFTDEAPKLVNDLRFQDIKDYRKRSLNFLKKTYKSDFDMTKDSFRETPGLRKAKSTVLQARRSKVNADISASISQSRKDLPEEKVFSPPFLKKTKTSKRYSDSFPCEGSLRKNLEKVKGRRKVFLVKENGGLMRKELMAAFETIRNVSPSRRNEKASLVIFVSKK